MVACLIKMPWTSFSDFFIVIFNTRKTYFVWIVHNVSEARIVVKNMVELYQKAKINMLGTGKYSDHKKYISIFNLESN